MKMRCAVVITKNATMSVALSVAHAFLNVSCASNQILLR